MSEPLHLLLDAAAKREASDLHLAAGEMPWLRVAGEMTPLPMDTGPLTAGQIQAMLVAAMSPADRSRWESAAARSIDFAYAVPSLGRFRINASHTLTGVAAVVRRIPHEIPTAEALGLPEVVTRLAGLPAGLVFVTGASGEGKSTTLAALVDTINRTREGHVLTIEDPIEYAHAPRRCRITQREVGVHTETFTRALEDAVRQDPDVIVVGEVRTAATLQLILEAAETGHLVMGSLHTINAVSAITRMVGMVETARQGQVRAQLAEALRAVVTQRLVPTVDGRRVAAFEVLVNTPAIAANIASGNTTDIRSAMEGRREGMQTLEQSLAELVAAGQIPYDAAREHANDVKSVDRRLTTGQAAAGAFRRA
ncbi:MAG TPA: PilT/PilU family type 4a pilus ATPase [Longimicrobiaceae bacterium]|jgi:twitching motility protein PilT|nr:PilT/PilU family type 4a pilus ATPase [Longimicrobiaceae bacterium]